MNKRTGYIAGAIAVIVIIGLVIFFVARGKGKTSQ